MTAFNRSSRLTAELPDLFADIAAPLIPDYTDDVLEITAATRQRPRWTFPERWLPMTIITRQPILAPRLPWRAIGILLIVLALLAATLYAVSSQRRVPPPFGPARNGAIVFGNGDIYVRDSLEEATRLLVGGSTDDRSGGFTRDGTHLTYLRKVAGAADGTGERLAAVVANLDGSNAQVLTGPMIAPSVSDLSPDSSLAVVAQGDPDMGQKLYTYGTTAPGELHQIDVGDPAMMMDYPSFLEPSGKEILFRGTTPTNTGVHSGIFAVHPDGSGLRRITLTDGGAGTSSLSPQPSPDSRYITYTDWGYTNSVHLVDLTTGADPVIDPQGDRSQGWPGSRPTASRSSSTSTATRPTRWRSNPSTAADPRGSSVRRILSSMACTWSTPSPRMGSGSSRPTSPPSRRGSSTRRPANATSSFGCTAPSPAGNARPSSATQSAGMTRPVLCGRARSVGSDNHRPPDLRRIAVRHVCLDVRANQP